MPFSWLRQPTDPLLQLLCFKHLAAYCIIGSMSGALAEGSAQLRGQTTAFLDFCRIEKGLSSNSLEAYAADLARFTAFTGTSEDLPATPELRIYIDHLYQTGLSNRSVGRHLTTIRSFYGFLLREGRIQTDPTEHLHAPKQWQTIPKYLNLEEINRIIQAPDPARPTGLRDRAMVEVLYASGLRVSELCKLGMGDLDLSYQVLRTTGKGNKQRLVPVGKDAIRAVEAYLGSGRNSLLKGRASRYLFVTARGGCMTRQGF